MKRRIITTASVMGLLLALSAGDLFAAGRNGGGAGSRTGAGTARSTGTTATVRPADSQRRDGTFLGTGTTASGAATRPGNGSGLRDGSRLNTTTTLPATAP